MMNRLAAFFLIIALMIFPLLAVRAQTIIKIEQKKRPTVGLVLSGGIGILHNPKVFPTFLGSKAYVGAWYEGGNEFGKFNTLNYR